MEYLDSKHRVISQDKVAEQEKKLEKHLEEQPNTLVKDQLKARQQKKQLAEAKELKVPWYKKSLGGDRISATDKIMMLDNLATMLKAGLALAPALSTLGEEVKSKTLKRILKTLKRRVENGELLSTGMKDFPQAFPEMIIATVEVGEASGLLSETLGHISDILKAEKALKSKVISALMYPAVVLVALIGVSLVLTFYVFPKLVAIFEESGVALPIILIIVTTIISLFENYGLYILAGAVVVISILVLIFKRPGPKLWFHQVILKIPFAGRIMKEIQLTRLTGNLQVLLASGLPIIKAISIIAKTMGNLEFRRVVLKMAGDLEKGVTLHKTMSDRKDLFPSLTVQLVQVGEETGELEEILGKVSEFYNTRVNTVLANLSVIIEPALLIIVGVVVGFIAVSVIGPIYELTNSFSD